MQKKIQSLKLIVSLLTSLVIVGIAFAGGLPSALAGSLSNFSPSTSCAGNNYSNLPDSDCNSPSTSCAGNNYSNLPDSDCNSNTPDPLQESCQLAWMDGGGGTIALDVRNVADDQGLRSTLGGYN